MRMTYWFACIVGLALAVVALFMPAMNAQTVISNEHLVSTTLVVNRKSSAASCVGNNCSAEPVAMFNPIYVSCPAAIGKTCTLNIMLDAKTEISDYQLGDIGDVGRYQFLVDGKAPVPGPTDGQGFYIFSAYGATYYSPPFVTRISYPASVIGRVTNSKSKDHKIEVGLSCNSVGTDCNTAAHWSTMRVDVFEP
jgi:hypothetical protein